MNGLTQSHHPHVTLSFPPSAALEPINPLQWVCSKRRHLKDAKFCWMCEKHPDRGHNLKALQDNTRQASGLRLVVLVTDEKQVLPFFPQDKTKWCNAFIIKKAENNKLLHGSMAQLDSEPLSQRSCSVSTEISFQLFHGSFFQKSTIAAAELRSQQHWHWHHHPICYSRPFFFFFLQDHFKHSHLPWGHSWCAQTEPSAETKFLKLPPLPCSNKMK